MKNNYLAAIVAASVIAAGVTPASAQIPPPADASMLSKEYTGTV